MCGLLDVSRSSYYEWLHRPVSIKQIEKQQLTERIRIIFEQSRMTYGTRRIKRALARDGIQASRRRIRKLLAAEQGLVVKTKKNSRRQRIQSIYCL